MAVKDFIPITESKLTIEKQVKTKPSIQELTTVETPGKPMPASLLEKRKKPRKASSPKKPRTSRKTSKLEEGAEEGVEESEPKKEYILIITEKPQAALKIATALGSAKKITENTVSYYEVSHNNEKIVVASAVGHLFNLTYSKGQVGWPIFNTEWHPSYEKASSAFTKKYFTLLKKLCRKAKEVMIATDYDIEGEVIGWNILRFICNQKTAKRMKFSTLTSNELKKAYEHPESELNWGNARAGETRHIVDWLYGINLSRALMSSLKKENVFRILSIGRVQGPTLKIIVDKEREIAKFKSQPYWQVIALSKDTEFKHPKDIFNKKELDKFKGIKDAIAETKKSEEKISPPVPFDLTSLQREAYNLHKISPSQTLQIAQKLYLDGLISYPRTSSQKIPSSVEPLKILEKLASRFPEVKIANRKIPIEGKKSDPAHPSIYPTGEPANLEEGDEKLYNLIVKRFISVFCPDAVLANKRVILTAKDNITFTAGGLKILEKGWSKVYPASFEEKDIPDLNGKVKIDKINFLEKETQPPKRYTPASLITLLEKKNLGTKSTRSIIVDTLYNRGYLDGQSIKSTPLGTKLIEALEKYSPIIIDENLTKQLEKEMESIQASKKDLEKKEEETIAKAKKIIEDISKEFKLKEADIGKSIAQGITNLREMQKEESEIMPCPVCGKGKLRIIYSKKTRRYFVACDKYPECKTTYSLPPNALIKKTDKVDEQNRPILMALRKGKKPWFFPFNPNWKEEQNQKSQEQQEEQNK